jgi:hypothetical protein
MKVNDAYDFIEEGIKYFALADNVENKDGSVMQSYSGHLSFDLGFSTRVLIEEGDLTCEEMQSITSLGIVSCKQDTSAAVWIFILLTVLFIIGSLFAVINLKFFAAFRSFLLSSFPIMGSVFVGKQEVANECAIEMRESA